MVAVMGSSHLQINWCGLLQGASFPLLGVSPLQPHWYLIHIVILLKTDKPTHIRPSGNHAHLLSLQGEVAQDLIVRDVWGSPA